MSANHVPRRSRNNKRSPHVNALAWVLPATLGALGSATARSESPPDAVGSDENPEAAEPEEAKVPGPAVASGTPDPQDPPPLDFQAECEARLKCLRHGGACEPEQRPDGTRHDSQQSTEKPDPTRKERRRDKRRQRWAPARNDWFYLVCVDFTNPLAPRTVVLPSEPGADERTHESHIFAGKRVHLRVWHQPAVSVAATMSGAAGVPNLIHDGTAATQEKRKAEKPKHTDEAFGPRAKGGAEVITISATGGVTRTFAIPLVVEEVYVGAFRAGAAIGWAPTERKYSLRAGSATNPGYEVTISDGDPEGAPYLDFTLGYSIFTAPVLEYERRATFAIYLGAAMVGTMTDGISFLTALHAGPELAIGRDFSIVLDFSLRRGERLKGGVHTGDVRSDDGKITRFGVHPGFGILLNFSPRVWKAVGSAAK